MIKIFAQTKKNLFEKISIFANEDSEDEMYYKDMLQKWIAWFEGNRDKIVLNDLSQNRFYKIYCDNPDIFGIQIWEKKDEVYVWSQNLYVNKDLEENDGNTILCSS